MTRSVTILGSTGSVGRSTVALLDAAPPGAFAVEALVAHRDVAGLAAQARRLRARLAVVADPACLSALREALAGSGIEAAAGPEAVVEAAARPADWTMAAIVGAAGLPATLAALRRGGVLALANKETLVCAGEIVLATAQAAGATLLPVDSEHNAIFQALESRGGGADPYAMVDKIVLTASGGPFRTMPLEQMAAVTPEAAVKHHRGGPPVPGARGAGRGAGPPAIHRAWPGALCGRVGDGAAGIAGYAHPHRPCPGLAGADGGGGAEAGPRRARAAGVLRPRPGALPRAAPGAGGLRLAREALRAGCGATTILNAANEVAVGLFLDRRLSFLDIAAVVEEALARLGAPAADELGAVLALDRAARDEAARIAAERVAA